MFFPVSRIIAFIVSLVAVGGLWLFLKRTYLGTAIRAISQDRDVMPLMGVSPQRIYLVTSALGGGLAGLGACLLVLLYDIHPAIGLTFGPIPFLVCVLGGPGQLIGRFTPAFLFPGVLAPGGFYAEAECG